MGITAAVVAVTAATVGSQVIMANNQKKQAQALADQQKSQSDQMIAQQKQQETDQASQAAAQTTQENEIDAQRQKASTAQGMQGTILTSPLGIQNSSPVQGGKTLLGA